MCCTTTGSGRRLVAPLPRYLSRVRIVQTVHGLDNQRAKWNRAARAALGTAHWLSGHVPHVRIAVSRTLAAHFRDRFGTDTRYVPNGVAEPRRVPAHQITTRFGLTTGGYLLLVGRLVPEKAADLLIRAFRRLPTRLRLAIVGGSSFSDDYVAALRAAAGDDRRIVFTGFAYGDLIAELYTNAAAFVQPSRLEGLPLTLLEAASYGLPLVASDIRPHVELISPGRSRPAAVPRRRRGRPAAGAVPGAGRPARRAARRARARQPAALALHLGRGRPRRGADLSFSGRKAQVRDRTTVLTALAAAAAALAAGYTAWSLGAGHRLAAVVPIALVLGVVVAGLAVTRFGAFVVLLLAVRPMVDLVKLSGPTAGRAGVAGDAAVSRAFDPSTLLAVLFLIAAGLWLAARARRDGRLRGSPLSAGLLLVGATALISALGADRPGNSLLEALRILTVVVMFVVLEQLVPDQRYARRVLLATYLALALVVAYTVLTSLTGHPPAEVKGSFVRITGPFAQSTTFGRYLMFLLIFGVAVYRYLSGRSRVAMAVLLALSLVFLFLTNTRSAILGVAIGLVVVAVLQRSVRMLVALCLTAVLGLVLLPAVGDRFAQLADARAVGGAPTGNTLAWRLGYWSEIVSLANRNPVTGIGPNMTQFQTDEAKKPHNDFLRAYVETGVVGLVAYVPWWC